MNDVKQLKVILTFLIDVFVSEYKAMPWNVPVQFLKVKQLAQ